MSAKLPTREEILAFVQSSRGKAGKREIAKAFSLKGGDRVALKSILAELEDGGEIARGRKGFARKGQLPDTLLLEITGRDRDGEAIGEPVEWDRKNGRPPRVVLPARKGGPVPGPGARVLVRLSEGDADDRPVGRILKVIEATRSRVLGVFRRARDGSARIVPVDKKSAGREMQVPDDLTGDAEDGELVAVETAKGARFGLTVARVVERLGAVNTEKAISLIAIIAHGIPHVFRPDTIEEAEAAKPATLKGREDWRKLALITIDPADAKDHDDAVHAAPDEDPDNEGGFIVTVAIADVAAYVRPGGALDREALVRGNSVYFPDRVVPMLPERISNDLCSLKPGVDRAAIAVRMIIGKDGAKRRHSFHRVLMRSAAKLAYEEAQGAIDGRVTDATDGLVEPILKPLWAAYTCVKQARDRRSPLDLDLPERKILLRGNGTVDRVVVPLRLDAHRLIEEFMILANVAAAETLEDRRQPLIYRVHDEPSMEKIVALREFLRTLDIGMAKQGALRAAEFNRILAAVEGADHERLVNEVVLRSQSQAIYDATNIGHFGLNLRRYAHFTSPIRRYADLIVHRALIAALGLGDDGLARDITPKMLAEVAERISQTERRAMAAERETIDRLIAHHLVDQIGASFAARVSGVTKAGLFVRLEETGADGFVPMSMLGPERFHLDETRRRISGTSTNVAWQLGDTVTVRLVEAQPFAGALLFEMLTTERAARHGRRVVPVKRPRVTDRKPGGRRRR